VLKVEKKIRPRKVKELPVTLRKIPEEGSPLL
jgi:hypothetical protein